MSGRAPQPSRLPEPIEIAKFWRNRRGEAVVVQLREYEGHVLVDARTHFTNSQGKLQATSKGLSLVIRKLPELASALAKAEVKARELGLLDEGAADE
jgi:hypothetical protein